MTANDVIKYWRDGALDAIQTAEMLMKGKRYHHALFFCHLAIEKQLKAAYVAKIKEVPPFIHDLLLLAEQTGMNLDNEIREQLREINTFNIEARYDDYKIKFYKKATSEFSKRWFNITKELITWFKTV